MNEQSAKALLRITQADTIKDLREHEIISNKLYVLLSKEMDDPRLADAGVDV